MSQPLAPPTAAPASAAGHAGPAASREDILDIVLEPDDAAPAPNASGETSTAAPGGRALRIGLLGTSGAGKTTYQTALAYTLVRQHDSERDAEPPLYGQPVGGETRQFLSVRVQDLVQGRFPLPTNDATELRYRLELRDRANLVCIKDYRGGDLAEIYANDGPSPKDLPPDLQRLAAYFDGCDGYIFLVNARVLLLDEHDEQFQRFFNEFLLYKQVLQTLAARHTRRGGAGGVPVALVATQSDALDLDDPAVRQRLDQALHHLRDEFRRYIRHQATFLTSAVGPNFLDPATGQRLPHARLEPQNVVAPLRFVLQAQRDGQRRRRRRVATTLLAILLGGIALGLGLGWLDARQRLAEVTALAEEATAHSRPALETALARVAHEREALGLLWLLVPPQGARELREARETLLRELDERDYRAFAEQLAAQPVELARLDELATAYLAPGRHLGRWRNTRYREKVREQLDDARRHIAQTAWEQAQARDDVEGYVAYLAAAPESDESYYVERAHERLQQLRAAPYAERWRRIVRRATLHAQDHDENVVRMHAFLEEWKQLADDVRESLDLHPSPYEEFQRTLDLWDQTTWHQLEVLFQEKMSIAQGKPQRDLLPVIERYEQYLTTIGRYRTPAKREEAQARINFLREVSERHTYQVRLLHGQGRLTDVAEPDLFVKVYVNDEAVLETERRGQPSTTEPVWNADFTLNWRAYDEIRVEVWEAHTNLYLFNADTLVHTWRDASPQALQRILGEPLTHRKTEGHANEFVTLQFEIR